MNSTALYIAAINYNFLQVSAALSYGSKNDFIMDEMEECLKNNIISNFAYTNPIWIELGISAEDCEVAMSCRPIVWSVPAPKNPHYWNIGFKKVSLPEGYSMIMGCSCGRNMNESTFHLVCDNKVVKVLTYFEKE